MTNKPQAGTHFTLPGGERITLKDLAAEIGMADRHPKEPRLPGALPHGGPIPENEVLGTK